MRHFDIWAGESFGRRLTNILRNLPSKSAISLRTRGLFLESPVNFSGPKRQLANCNLLALKSCSFNMFFNVRKSQEYCEVWWPLRRYKGNCGIRNRPEMFRNFWETGLGSDKISVMHYWLEEQSKTETCITCKGTSARMCRVSFQSRAYTIHFRACHVFNFRHIQRQTCAHATCFTGNTR